MIDKELPQHIKWINAIVLVVMTILTVAAIAPWIAWKVDPAAHAYGWNRFSYFTVQSNFIAAITYLIAATAIFRRRKMGGWFRYLRGAAVLYMLVTGIVSALLLRNAEVNPNPGEFNWNNFILHEVGPLFILIWWLLWPSRLPVSARNSLLWLVFPLLWTIYTFIRASMTGWYPYPFLDPARAGGTIGVSGYVVGITFCFILLSLLLAWICRARANNHTLY